MKLLKQGLNSTIFKNLSVLVIGTVVAQAILILFQVILRRIYAPEYFGAFAVYMSLLGIITTVVSLRYEQAIVLPSDKRKSLALFRLSAYIIIGFVLLLFIFIFLFKTDVAKWVSLDKRYENWLMFLPFSVLFFSIYQAINFYIIRQKQFKLSGTNKVIRRIAEGGTQSVFGIFKLPVGLFIGDMLGQLVIIIRTLFANKELIVDKIPKTEIVTVAKRYKDFPLKSTLPSLFNSISLLFPVVLVNRFFNESSTAYFDLARMVLIIPLSLITASLSQVLLQQFTEKRNKKQSIKKDALGVFIPLVVFALIFALIIEFFGVPLFSFIFGDKYSQSGVYSKILVWAFAFKFVVSPFNVSFTAFEKIGIGSVWQTIYFLLILTLLFLPHNLVEIFLKNYLIIELVSYTIAAFLNFSIFVHYEKKIKSS